MAAEIEFRDLSPNERKMLDRMLSIPFPGRAELLEQARHASARRVGPEPGIEFQVTPTAKAQVHWRVPVEGETIDTDGVPILILLHIVDGMINELEFFKGDLSEIVGPIAPDSISVRLSTYPRPTSRQQLSESD